MADTGKLKFYNDFFSTETNPEILIVDTNMDTIDNNDNRMSLREAIITTQASDKKDWEIRFITREQDEKYVEQSPQLGLGYWAIKLQKPLPTIAKTDNSIKEKITLSLIPRFSGLFIIAIGILIITGPTLLWFLDDNVGSLTETAFVSVKKQLGKFV